MPAAAAAQQEEFLVSVDQGTGSLTGDIEAAGGTVEGTYDELGVIAVTLPPGAALSLDRREGVEVEPNPILRAFAAPPSYGLDRIDQRDLPLSSSYTYPSAASGAGVDVYVMDSGVRADHQQFGGRVAVGFSAINDGRGTGDCNGHGTHVAGTIGGSTTGVAPSVRIVPVRVLDCAGTTTTGFEFLDGINWILAHHQAGTPAVLNMSLGGSGSKLVDDAVSAAVADGIVVVAAAGNENTDACSTSPARAAAAITVAASTIVDARAAYSNFGACVDLFAPGGDGSAAIVSAGTTSATALAGKAGTSMAAPHVAGAAARFLSARPATAPQAVVDAILAAATPGRISSRGAGTPDLLLHAGADWPTPAIPVGRNVKPAYDRTGGAAGYLGQPISPEVCGLAAGGCAQEFAGGTALWSPSAGASSTDGAIREVWRGRGAEGGYLGYPVADPRCSPATRGCAQEFQGGTITWTAAFGAAAIDGAIASVWRASGAGAGWLGYPSNSPVCGLRSGACVQNFAAGAVVWTPSRGAIAVDGAIAATWLSVGAGDGALGYPVRTPSCAGGGCVQRFELGEVRWNGATGAFAFTSTAITTTYEALGGSAGYLRQPTSSALCDATGCSQTFQGGAVLVRSGASAAAAVDGALLTRWTAAGGRAGSLGYPVSNPSCAGGGCIQRFDGGRLFWSSSTGVTVLPAGAVSAEYDRLGGPASYLGWPTSDTSCGLVGGGCIQRYVGGRIAGLAAAYPLDGAILDLWLKNGAEAGALGYPLSTPVRTSAVPMQYRQTFERGSISWTAAGGAVLEQ
ncbi:MAG TPA: S8 family serine peptidase [Naasia sp.]|jgi:uncharacterized protein with LGFP repeats